jgi:hypothetical protein
LIACYLGFSIPALGVGIAADRIGLFAALVGAAVVLGALGAGIMVAATDRNLEAMACTV